MEHRTSMKCSKSKLGRKRRGMKGSEDKDTRACGVCGDLASGYHFDALTCDTCAGFFRRIIQRPTQLRCPFLNKCIITIDNRRLCQACRFRKCKAIGMRKEMVMPMKEVLERRMQKKWKRMLDAPVELSSQQKETIEELLWGHRSTSLTMQDQVSLLKGATFEIMQIRFNMLFNTNTGIWECGHITYCLDDAARARFQQLLLKPLFKFHHTLGKLGLQEEEYVLIQAMSLFSPACCSPKL